MLTTALRFRMLGVSCVPIQSKNKHYDTKAMASRGYELADLKERLPSIDDLKYWFENSDRRLAIITDKVICADFDSLAQYKRFRRDYTTLSYTMTVKSPSKGFHCYYEIENLPCNPIQVTWPDVELKHSGQAIITAGEGYEIVGNGLLNKHAKLQLTDVTVLPFVKCKVHRPHKEKSVKENPNSSFMRFHNPIQTIKQNLPISQFLTGLGYDLKPTGEGKYICSCPLHNDDNPSFWIDDNFRNCNCFAPECKARRAMDILDLHGRLNNCDLKKSIFELKSHVGL